jgi:NADH-quinone oxidoreductase, E subunit
MSVRRLAADQPEDFAFTPENRAWLDGQIAKYPAGRQASAVIPALWRAQEQHGGWIPEAAIQAIADILGMPKLRVLEVATFYTMFNLEPVGRHLVQICRTTPCWLRGSDELTAVCRDVIAPQPNMVSEDQAFSWMEVECLGACSNAPMVQINDDYFEDLTPETFRSLLEKLRAGEEVSAGSLAGRTASAPAHMDEKGNGHA